MAPPRNPWTSVGWESELHPGVTPLNYDSNVKKADRGKRIQELHEFGDAINELLGVSRPIQDSYLGPPIVAPIPGMEVEWAGAKAKADRLSMRAAHTMAAAGSVVEWKPPGTHPANRQRINPAANWATIVTRSPMAVAAVLMTCINQALGALEDGLGSSSEPAKESLPSARHVPNIVVGIIIAVASGLIVAYLAFRWGWVGG